MSITSGVEKNLITIPPGPGGFRVPAEARLHIIAYHVKI